MLLRQAGAAIKVDVVDDRIEIDKPVTGLRRGCGHEVVHARLDIVVGQARVVLYGLVVGLVMVASESATLAEATARAPASHLGFGWRHGRSSSVRSATQSH
eukprot:scaffold10655_cov65-Phaeocystis_antarctica.AAC.5